MSIPNPNLKYEEERLNNLKEQLAKSDINNNNNNKNTKLNSLEISMREHLKKDSSINEKFHEEDRNIKESARKVVYVQMQIQQEHQDLKEKSDAIEKRLDKINHHQSLLKNDSAELARLNNEKIELERQKEELNKKRKELEQKEKKLKSEKELLNESKQKFSKECYLHKQKIEEEQKQIEVQWHKREDELKQKQDKFNEQYEILINERAKLERQQEEIECNRENLESEKYALEQERKNTRGSSELREIEKKEKELHDRENKLMKLENILAFAQEKLEQKQIDLEKKTKELAEKNERLKILEERFSQVQVELKGVEQERKRAEQLKNQAEEADKRVKLAEAQAAAKEELIRKQLEITEKSSLQLIINAVKRRDIPVVKELLELGFNPNMVDGQGRTALHYAVMNRHKEMIEKLLEGYAKNRANPNIPDQSGMLPLHYAAERKYLDIATLLLNYSDNPTKANTKDNNGRTAKDTVPFPNIEGGAAERIRNRFKSKHQILYDLLLEAEKEADNLFAKISAKINGELKNLINNKNFMIDGLLKASNKSMLDEIDKQQVIGYISDLCKNIIKETGKTLLTSEEKASLVAKINKFVEDIREEILHGLVIQPNRLSNDNFPPVNPLPDNETRHSLAKLQSLAVVLLNFLTDDKNKIRVKSFPDIDKMLTLCYRLKNQQLQSGENVDELIKYLEETIEALIDTMHKPKKNSPFWHRSNSSKNIQPLTNPTPSHESLKKSILKNHVNPTSMFPNKRDITQVDPEISGDKPVISPVQNIANKLLEILNEHRPEEIVSFLNDGSLCEENIEELKKSCQYYRSCEDKNEQEAVRASFDKWLEVLMPLEIGSYTFGT